MKRTLFALFAVLLALSLTTCDLLELPLNTDDDSPDSTEDGRSMARLAINVVKGGTGRALTTDLAQADVDYYEVVFKTYGGEYYQVEFDKNANDVARTIEIPPGDYTGAENAVMFAGIDVSGAKVLLAIGIISRIGDPTDDHQIDPSNQSDRASINLNTTSVTFTLTALKNKVGGDITNNEYTAATSTFEILGPTSANSFGSSTGGSQYDTVRAGIEKTTSGPPYYPVFPIPPHGYPNTNNTDFTTTDGNIIGAYSVTIPHDTAVMLQADWTAATAAYTAGGSEVGVDIGTTNLHLLAKPTNSALDPTCVFTFIVDVNSLLTDGLCAVSINAPVSALTTYGNVKKAGTSPKYRGDASDKTLTWNIRGGTDNDEPDGASVETSPGSGEFVASPSSGGAVILSVGPYPAP